MKDFYVANSQFRCLNPNFFVTGLVIVSWIPMLHDPIPRDIHINQKKRGVGIFKF